MLVVLARLPGGARRSDLSSLAPDDLRSFVDPICDQLSDRALVNESNGRLTMLSPIRLHLQSSTAIPVAERERDWERVEAFFFDLAVRRADDSPTVQKTIWPRVIKEEYQSPQERLSRLRQKYESAHSPVDKSATR